MNSGDRSRSRRTLFGAFGVTGVIRKLTARLRGQQEREEARGQLEAILQGVADAVTAQGPDGRLLFANDAAVRTLGFGSTEELLNAPINTILDRFDILDDDRRPFPVGALPGRRALAGEDAPEAVVRFRVRGTGEESWAAVKATPIRDHDGNVSMAINVIEDITAHKRAELGQRFLARSGGARLVIESGRAAGAGGEPGGAGGGRLGCGGSREPRAAASTARRSRTPTPRCASGRSR